MGQGGGKTNLWPDDAFLLAGVGPSAAGDGALALLNHDVLRLLMTRYAHSQDDDVMAGVHFVGRAAQVRDD